jgi:hypothetical protein
LPQAQAQYHTTIVPGLDSVPRTLAAKDHRPAYGSDGDYYSKPSPDDVYDALYEMMHEADTETHPLIYSINL